MAEAHVNAHDDGGAKPKRGDPARVYVGNLSWTTTSEQLLAHMQQAGTVVFADILTGRDGSVVEYENEEDARRAISSLTDTQVEGTKRLIFVREVRYMLGHLLGRQTRCGEWTGKHARLSQAVVRRPDHRYVARHCERAPPSHGVPGVSLYVGNLPYSVSWQDLKDHFRSCGTVVRADVARGRDGRSRGYGTVVFENAEDAQRAIATLHDSEFNGRPIIVHEDKFSQQ